MAEEKEGVALVFGGAQGDRKEHKELSHAPIHLSTIVRTCQTPRHGYLAGHIWAKTVRASRHQLRKPPAWALDLGDLEVAEGLGVQLVAIRDAESGETHWATLTTIRRRGFQFERGHGAQIALPLKWWRSSPQEALALAGEVAA